MVKIQKKNIPRIFPSPKLHHAMRARAIETPPYLAFQWFYWFVKILPAALRKQARNALALSRRKNQKTWTKGMLQMFHEMDPREKKTEKHSTRNIIGFDTPI